MISQKRRRHTKAVNLAHAMTHAEFLKSPPLIFGDLQVEVGQFGGRLCQNIILSSMKDTALQDGRKNEIV
ncbi:hypothetical protein AN189_06210 [Loktanella sp. 3ANDIMAR09]|nr:hypothetical protein AN189_06210 [Loktanella sp. 3ANDIMAR09]